VVREAIHAFKFGGKRALADPLGDLLAETRPVLPPGPLDLLVPVPLHRRRERDRGFNQSWLLARRLAWCWQVAALPDVLERPRRTLPQADLGATERRRNVHGAFRVKHPGAIRGCHVVLVDDIMTTGATAGECAALLEESGAAVVGVVAVARAG
jgi:ComF family protein